MFKIRYQLVVRQIYFFRGDKYCWPSWIQFAPLLFNFCSVSQVWPSFFLCHITALTNLTINKIGKKHQILLLLFVDIDFLVDFVDLHFIAEASPHDEL